MDIQGNSKVVTLKVVTPPSQVVTLDNNRVKVVTQDNNRVKVVTQDNNKVKVVTQNNNPLLLRSQPQVSTRTLLKDKPDMARYSL